MTADQLTLNEFEAAILDRLADETLRREFRDGRIRVVKRQFTGAGSYTDFYCPPGDESAHICLDVLISMPGVPNGMGAALHMKGRHPHCLEVFTYGGESWDGSYDGFSIGDPVRST